MDRGQLRGELRERYGAVLLGALLALFITIALPARDQTAGVLLALQGSVLLLAMYAAPPTPERYGPQAASVAAIIAAFAGLAGGVPNWVLLTTSAIFLLVAIATLARGALTVLRTEGVTAPLISAALAIYLLVGMLFATVIGVIAAATDAPYFASGVDGNAAENVYYSFTALTTTGFGDYTPALPVGRALGVAEMLLGQIYLVTVVALLISNLRRRPPSE